MGGVFEGPGGRFPSWVTHPWECLGSPDGREAGRREELRGKREGLGHNTDFFTPSESLGPWGASSCRLGCGVTWEQRSCLHCGGASLIAGRAGGQTRLGGKRKGGGILVSSC